MRDLDFDDRDESYNDDERRAGIDAPICYCGDRYRRVVRNGMCARCLEATDDSRADARWRTA